MRRDHRGFQGETLNYPQKPDCSLGGVEGLPFFKSGMQVLEQGHDFVSRGDFAGAQERFTEATRKLQKEGALREAAVAAAYAAVMNLGRTKTEPAAYRYVAQNLRYVQGSTLKLGPRQVLADDLAAEADLLAEELEARSLQPSTPADYQRVAQWMQTLAVRFQQRGDQVLVFDELFRKSTVQASSKAPLFAAMAEEAKGQAVVLEDPKRAAEHYQNASNWWLQIGYQDFAARAAQRVREYGKSAKCWFCGREVSGEGVHFVAMPTEITGLLQKIASGTAIPTFDSGTKSLHACRACHGAIYKLADHLALQRVRELQAKIELELARISQEIASLRHGYNSLNSRVATAGR